MATLIAEVRRTRLRAAKLRDAAHFERARTEQALSHSRIAMREHQVLYERLVLPSPWSDLPWQLPATRDLDRVLVPLAGDRV